jgi:hypothetical protein
MMDTNVIFIAIRRESGSWPILVIMGQEDRVVRLNKRGDTMGWEPASRKVAKSPKASVLSDAVLGLAIMLGPVVKTTKRPKVG